MTKKSYGPKKPAVQAAAALSQEGYQEIFTSLVVEKTAALRGEGYLPLIGSEIEVRYRPITKSEADRKRDKFYADVVEPEGKEKLATMPEDSADVTAKQNLRENLAKAKELPLEKLAAFYLHEIRKDTCDILEPAPFGQYEDNPGIYESAIKATTPDLWCKNYRAYIAALHKVSNLAELKIESCKQHYHTSLHTLNAGEEPPENPTLLPNLCAPAHADYITTGKRLLELQAKALQDGYFFLAGPEKLKRPDPGDRIDREINASPLKGGYLRPTRRSFEIRYSPPLANDSPEIIALLFCLSPMICAVRPDAANIAPDALTAGLVTKYTTAKSDKNPILSTMLNGIVYNHEDNDFDARLDYFTIPHKMVAFSQDMGFDISRYFPDITMEKLKEDASDLATNPNVINKLESMRELLQNYFLLGALSSKTPQKGDNSAFDLQWPDAQNVTAFGQETTYGELFAASAEGRRILGHITPVQMLSINKKSVKPEEKPFYDAYTTPDFPVYPTKDKIDKEVQQQLEGRVRHSDIFKTALGETALAPIMKYGYALHHKKIVNPTTSGVGGTMR